LIKTYKKKGFTINGKNKISKDFPKLKDFYQTLKTIKQKDLA